MRPESRVPHVLHVFSTFVPAGPEIRTVRMMNAWGDEFRHSILSIDGRTDAREFIAESVPFRVLDPLPRAGTPRTVQGLRRILKRERPDLVCSYNWGAFDSVIATRLSGLARRHLHHEDGFNADEAAEFIRRRVWMRRLLLGGVARVIVPSNRLEKIATSLWKQRPERVALIPNGIAIESFGGAPDEALRSSAGIPVGAPVIGFVGHLRPVKNLERLLRAFARIGGEELPHLLILGEGPEREPFESLARELQVDSRIHLVGHQGETAPWYSSMDVFTLTSDSEQMPVALLEAMASSLPIVSTDVGDVRRILPDTQGVFVVPLDTDALPDRLAAAFERLLADTPLRDELGKANRTRVEERYTFETMLSTYRELYERTAQIAGGS
jgi:L-malate glycosyltransferase